MDDRQLDRMDAELARIAREGTVEEYVQAMLAHPIHGRLMRAFALEEDAPEYDETMRRVEERFGANSEREVAAAAAST